MAAGTHNIVIDKGSDFAFQVNVKQNGVAVDLTNYSARAQLRATKTSTSALVATFNCSVLSPASNGSINISLPNASTSNVEPGKYYYDLEIYTANNAAVTRLLQGDVTVTPEITR